MGRDFSVSIIIPNWNGRVLLEENLPLVLKAKNYKKNNIKEIIVVDDKSEDESLKFLQSNYKKKVKIICHRINRGFSAAVNTGVRMAKGKLVCLLNTDVKPSKNFLMVCLKHFKDPKVFAVSFHEKGYRAAVGKFEDGFIVHAPAAKAERAIPTFWANAGSAVFRRTTWLKLKGMDERLFSPFYWEDIDISYRAMKRGYSILWEPNAKVIHKHESVINPSNFNTRRLNLIKQRNQLLFIWKNLTSPILFKKHLRGLVKRLARRPGYIFVFFAAFIKLRTVLKERSREKKESTISDEAIFAQFKNI